MKLALQPKSYIVAYRLFLDQKYQALCVAMIEEMPAGKELPGRSLATLAAGARAIREAIQSLNAITGTLDR